MPAGPKGQAAPSWVTPHSSNPTSYRVMLEILETLGLQGAQDSQDFQESLGFGALQGQKEKRSVKGRSLLHGHKETRWRASEGRLAGQAMSPKEAGITGWRLRSSFRLGALGTHFDFPG